VNGDNITVAGSVQQREQGALHDLIGLTHLRWVEDPAEALRHALGERSAQRRAMHPARISQVRAVQQLLYRLGDPLGRRKVHVGQPCRNNLRAEPAPLDPSFRAQPVEAD
jgi:hypothetical protein